MSISKRLRYQVLRRDNYTCRYCGAFAPVAVLVIDHVTPRKHGGQDMMENLVTACEDCNSGKSASLPEPWLVRELPPPSDLDEDDLFSLKVYRDSLRELEALPSAELLHWIAQAYIAAQDACGIGYRPTHSELIMCASGMACNAVKKGTDGPC